MKKFYITTSIAYANAKPHLGFVLESIQADALARWARSKGRPVRFLTGTDEHGLKIARAAVAAGEPTRQFVDKISAEFRRLREAFHLSWDDFIRTSDEKRHWPGALELFRRLRQSGDIYEKKYSGWYCVGCEGFVTEKDLVDGCCPLHRKKPEWVEEINFFFRLSRYAEPIRKEIEANRLKIVPETRRNEVLAFIRSGLEDISVSRPKTSHPWGIPIPDSDQTLYVWCDALSNYISSLGFGSADLREFKRWWPADIQLVGKDILRFHALFWPGMLLSARLPLPKGILVHGFITVDGEKMSKSIGNVVDPFGLAEEFSAEAVRYYLLREIPSDEDGDFSRDKFIGRYNGDLANGLGNFASRVSTLGEGLDFSGRKPAGEIRKKITEAEKRIDDCVENFKLHEALAAIWDLLKFGDGYVNQNRPWEKRDPKIIFNLVYLLFALAGLLEPFLPETGEKIKSAFERSGRNWRVRKIDQLFPRNK
jgi:methionyl-tRNA synthetase